VRYHLLRGRIGFHNVLCLVVPNMTQIYSPPCGTRRVPSLFGGGGNQLYNYTGIGANSVDHFDLQNLAALPANSDVVRMLLRDLSLVWP